MKAKFKTLAIVFTLIVPVTVFAAARISVQDAQKKIDSAITSMYKSYEKLKVQFQVKEANLEKKYDDMAQNIERQMEGLDDERDNEMRLLEEKYHDMEQDLQNQYDGLEEKKDIEQDALQTQFITSKDKFFTNACKKLRVAVTTLQAKVGTGGTLTMENAEHCF